MRDSFGVQLRFTVGSSGMLARQIENGAPYDVYLSANERFVTELATRGMVLPGSVCVYTVGRLGLWSKDGKIRDLKQLTDPRVHHLAIPNPAHAPYGAAAKEALTRLGLWRALEGRLIYAENVRQAFEYASSGNAEAVITAWSMVFDRGGILIDASWHAPLRQSGAVVSTSKQPRTAQRLLDFLMSPRGQALFAQP
jgi:molybdate transport system substrate-binding protein